MLFYKLDNYFIMKTELLYNLNILKISKNLLTQTYLIDKIN